MGIWDKSEALSHPRLTDTFERDTPFTLLGMELTEAMDLGNDLGPAKVNLLTVRGAREDGAQDGKGWKAYGETVTVGVISGPIQDLNENAGPGDFPVVVKWTKVQPKDASRAEATVLALVSKQVDVK